MRGVELSFEYCDSTTNVSIPTLQELAQRLALLEDQGRRHWKRFAHFDRLKSTDAYVRFRMYIDEGCRKCNSNCNSDEEGEDQFELEGVIRRKSSPAIPCVTQSARTLAAFQMSIARQTSGQLKEQDMDALELICREDLRCDYAHYLFRLLSRDEPSTAACRLLDRATSELQLELLSKLETDRLVHSTAHFCKPKALCEWEPSPTLKLKGVIRALMIGSGMRVTTHRVHTGIGWFRNTKGSPTNKFIVETMKEMMTIKSKKDGKTAIYLALSLLSMTVEARRFEELVEATYLLWYSLGDQGEAIAWYDLQCSGLATVWKRVNKRPPKTGNSMCTEVKDGLGRQLVIISGFHTLKTRCVIPNIDEACVGDIRQYKINSRIF